MGARKAGLLHRLVNEQTLPGILAKMPASDWKQWTKERPAWIGGILEDAFWAFIDQKWRDALNEAAAEPTGWSQGSISVRPLGTEKKDSQVRAEAKKLATAAIHVATTEERLTLFGGPPRKCKFAEILDCTGLHPPWQCGAFESKKPEERAKIIKDNKLCSFCLLHDGTEMCYAKVNKTKPACEVPECGGQHVQL